MTAEMPIFAAATPQQHVPLSMAYQTFPPPPDMRYIDALLLAYRLGHVRTAEQKQALIAASRAATDALSFFTALENFGVMRGTKLHSFVGEVMASPAVYRSRYARVVGMSDGSTPPERFLWSQYPLALVEAVLSEGEYKLFYRVYWWFTHNHQAQWYDPKKGQCIGRYATEPQDNASTLPRFEDFLYRLVHHTSERVRSRFDGFPADIVMGILRRAFT